jgi:phage tail sheath gpL-like
VPTLAAHFLCGVSATADAAAFVAAFNADTYVGKMFTASNAAGVITLTCNTPGYLGEVLDFTENTSGARIDLSTGITTSGAETTITFST